MPAKPGAQDYNQQCLLSPRKQSLEIQLPSRTELHRGERRRRQMEQACLSRNSSKELCESYKLGRLKQSHYLLTSK